MVDSTAKAVIEGFQAERPKSAVLKLIDSTPLVECARSVETTRRSALADAADYGWCASHSRFFWGFRLHGLFAPDGTPRAFRLASLPSATSERWASSCSKERSRRGGEILIGDKGYAGKGHGARTLHNLRARIAQRFLALAACVALKPQARASEPRPGSTTSPEGVESTS